MTIYPEVSIQRGSDYITFSTFLRKKHRGVWYLCHIYRDYLNLKDYMNLEAGQFPDFLFREFYRDVYLFDKLGKVIPKSLDSCGAPRFPKDTNQLSEKERLAL